MPGFKPNTLEDEQPTADFRYLPDLFDSGLYGPPKSCASSYP